MKKTFKELVLLSMSGLLLVAVGQNVIAQADSQASSSEESSESTDEAQVEESELQLAFNEAVALFQEDYPNAQIEEIEVELRNDEYKMSIHGFEDNIEYDIVFSLDPVEITNRNEENEDDNDDDSLNLDNLITIDEVSVIALDEAGAGTITDWDLDYDDGRFRWDIEIDGVENPNSDNDDNKLHIEVDAETGEIIETEFDD